MDLDVGQVRAFIAVVDHRHFGRAAASLHLTQQALSKRLARLEQAIGPLVLREQGGIGLTERGGRFLPTARQLVELADRAVALARSGAPAPLRVDVWGHLQPPAALLRDFAADHPAAAIEISMRRSLPHALTALERGEIDVAFGNVANLQPRLGEHLAQALVELAPIGALVNSAGPFARHASLTPVDLRRSGLWWPTSGSSSELSCFVAEYAAAAGIALSTYGRNLGLDGLIERVAAEPEIVTAAALDWPLPAGAAVRLLPIARSRCTRGTRCGASLCTR